MQFLIWLVPFVSSFVCIICAYLAARKNPLAETLFWLVLALLLGIGTPKRPPLAMPLKVERLHQV